MAYPQPSTIGRPEWRQLLARLEEILGTEAILAGGALRDNLMGKPVKDLDVFFAAGSPIAATDMIVNVQDSLPASIESIIAGEEYREWVGDQLLAVATLEPLSFDTIDLPQVNLIALPTGATLQSTVGRIDFGICQVGLTIREEFITEAFTKDFNEKTFTFTKDADQWPYSERRWLRLREKYPDFKLVGAPDPEEFGPAIFSFS